MTKAGYQSNLQLAFANTVTAGFMFSVEEINEAASELGVTLEANTGSVVFTALSVLGAPVAGYSLAISPQAGSGPFFVNATSGDFDPSLTTSSAAGLGSVVNLPTAKYKMDFSSTTLNCTDLEDVIVESGYLSYVLTVCL